MSLDAAHEVQETPEVADTPAQPEAQPQFDFRARFEQDGYNLEGWDDEKLYSAVTNALQRAGKVDEYEPIVAQARGYLSRADEIDAWLAEKDAAQQKPQPADDKLSAWKPPAEYDDKAEAMCEWNPQLGRFVVKEEFRQYVNPSVAEGLNKIKEWERGRAQHMVRNFPDAVREVIADQMEALKQEFHGTIKTYAQQAADYAFAQKYLQSHVKDFFQTDASGQPLVDANGQEAMTLHGQLFQHYVAEARQLGISDPKKVIEYGEKFTASALRDHEASEKAAAKAAKKAEPESKPQPTSAEINASRKESFVKRATNGSRIGNIAEPSAAAEAAALKAGRSKLDIKQIFKSELEKAGFSR